MNIIATLEKFKKHAEENGLNVYSIALKGSQNYNLSDDESDVDANLVFIPTPSAAINDNVLLKLIVESLEERGFTKTQAQSTATEEAEYVVSSMWDAFSNHLDEIEHNHG